LACCGRSNERYLILKAQGRLKEMTRRDETEFSPTDFYEELRSSIDEQIDVQIENFKKELLMVRPDKIRIDF
jgi:hypothetical protein